MEIFFEYDGFRLKNYQKIKSNQVSITPLNDLVIYAFPEVSYFNYAFKMNNHPIEIEEIKKAQKAYQSQNILNFKIITPHKINIDQKDIAHKNILTKLSLSKLEHPNFIQKASFEKVNGDNLLEFTETYLSGFEAENRCVKTVSNNFSKLLNHSNFYPYLIKNKDITKGVVVLYSSNGHQLLAGGAILPQYRKQNYHKQGVQFRLNKCFNDPNTLSIASWAYKNSVSMNNMVKCGLVPSQDFYIYEFSTKDTL